MKCLKVSFKNNNVFKDVQLQQKSMTNFFQKYRIPILLLAVMGTIYLFTLDHGLRPDELIGGDLITHQYAQAQARFSNAPGYPLYVMLGWFWFRVGRFLLGWVLNPIQILSFFSTIWGLASLWVLYHLLARKDALGDKWLSVLLTLFYGTTYFFWYYSVTTEQYSSAIFQTLLLVWLAFEWECAPKNNTLLWMAFVSGTMLANMLTTLFILPPLLYLIFTRRPDIFRRPKLILQAIIAGILPVLSYAFVYIRGAQHPEWRGTGNWTSTADWFWHFVSTQQGRDELAPGFSLQHLITPEYPSLIWHELTWLVLLGGLLGWLFFGKRKAIFFVSTFIIYLFFTTLYRFGNWFQVILPMYPLLVLGFGKSVVLLFNRQNKLGRRIIFVFLIALIGWRFFTSVHELTLHQHNTSADTALDAGWAILADVPSAGAEISPAFDEWLALQYLGQIWRAEPRIDLKKPNSDTEFITKNEGVEHPNTISGVAKRVSPQAVGANLIYFNPVQMTQLPPNVIPLDLDFGGQITLRGYQVSRGGALAMLYWTTPASIDENYTISVRLQTDTGEILIQDHRPVWNSYPTNQWRAGEIIPDAYTFDIPQNAQPKHLQIVIYRAVDGGFENLDVKEIHNILGD